MSGRNSRTPRRASGRCCQAAPLEMALYGAGVTDGLLSVRVEFLLSVGFGECTLGVFAGCPLPVPSETLLGFLRFLPPEGGGGRQAAESRVCVVDAEQRARHMCDRSPGGSVVFIPRCAAPVECNTPEADRKASRGAVLETAREGSSGGYYSYSEGPLRNFASNKLTRYTMHKGSRTRTSLEPVWNRCPSNLSNLSNLV